MINTLISSKTRIKLLLKFFLNSKNASYLRGLEQEFGDSTNAIRLELNKLEKAGMLSTFNEGNKKFFKANKLHPLYNEIKSIIFKHVGLDKIVDNVIERLGDVKQVYLTGDFAKGLNSDVVDLVFYGNVDQIYLIKLIEKAEEVIKRKIRYLIYSEQDQINSWNLKNQDCLLLWSSENE